MDSAGASGRWMSTASSGLRIGLGCMRLSTGEAVDEQTAVATIAAACAAGITVFDTARAYGRGPEPFGQNERLLANALRFCGAQATARVVTKGGMTRPDGAWLPDGRAGTIVRDCESSLAALDGLPIDLYLLHAPDPRTPWSTSVRALARLVDRGLVPRVGLANVTRHQLDMALDLAPISAVQVALSIDDDSAVRGGLLDRCAERGITVMAHSPLGGPRRAGRLARHAVLATVASARGSTPAEVALAWLLSLSPVVVPIPGARHPGTARSAAAAASLVLSDDERTALGQAFGTPAGTARAPSGSPGDADVVIVMGIPGAGKSRLAAAYTARGYVRLNRDERGGTLRDLCTDLDATLAAGARRVVLDNTWLTRAARNRVIETASRHGVATRCVWLDVPLAQAQVQLVSRMVERVGHLPGPAELRAASRREPGLLLPTSQMRALRELEPPSLDEGFAALETLAYARVADVAPGRPGVIVAANVLDQPTWQEKVRRADPGAPHLVIDWRPDGDAAAMDAAVAAVAAEVVGEVEGALCPHAAGPPVCWCRPPLPGLAVAFARARGVDLSRSFVVGVGPAHRSLAGAIGAEFIPA